MASAAVQSFRGGSGTGGGGGGGGSAGIFGLKYGANGGNSTNFSTKKNRDVTPHRTGINRENNPGERRDRERLETGETEDEIETDEPATKKQRLENHVVSANYFSIIVALMEQFGTKTTISYATPEGEKKRDKTNMVLWKMRTGSDGSNKLTIMWANKDVQEVIATEVNIVQQFRDIFDPNTASRIFELVGNGATVQSAVFQLLGENDISDGQQSN
jgi:hypothetical protein